MRQRILFVILGLVILLSVWLTLDNNRRRASLRPVRPVRPPHHASRTTPPAAEPGADSHLGRNIFEYGAAPEAKRVGPRAGRPGGAAPSPTASPTPSVDVRLVGVVRRVDGVRAALSIDGAVSVLAVGQSAGGVTVLSVDDDGATVRTPDGEQRLAPSGP